ncbi:hypothetical protein [Streptomyces sp. NPDC047061]|uniref:hypothetical protein n=1 Tax=Streptomyces sp. NPDC047061 TaxID=3154605 RepID=UPI0033CB79BF
MRHDDHHPLQHGRCRTHNPVGDNDEPTRTSETLTVTLVHGEEAHLSGDGPLDLLRAELIWDECFVDGSLWVASDYDDELALDRVRGENLADRLEALARQLRVLCKQLPAQDEDTVTGPPAAAAA